MRSNRRTYRCGFAHNSGADRLGVRARRSEAVAPLSSLLAHLRLHYQLLLAPIYLWGYLLSGALVGPDFWLGFLAFHLFLYGGITAFNSYYDRDEGPIGGMREPPPVSAPLLPFSLAVLGIGALPASLVNPTFLAIYLTILVMGLVYSHPRVRLKARPLLGLATVALGQGVLACLGGWAAARPDLATVDLIGWVGILAATLVTVGFYPITQAYQVQDDLARGDLTFAAWAGPRRALRFSLGVQALGALLLAITIADRMDLLRAALVVGFYTVVLTIIAVRAAAFGRLAVLEQYRRVMALNAVMSGGFLVFVVAHLVVMR